MSTSAEHYITSGCPWSAAAREGLEWRDVDFVDFDVERDAEALQRTLALSGGTRTVPVIVEEGKPIQIGWMGHGCAV